MPIPVGIPAYALSITNDQESFAELSLVNFLELMGYGSSGATLVTPALLVPAPTAAHPQATTSLLQATAQEQLFYRHLFIALATTDDIKLRTASSALTLGQGVYYATNDQVAPGSSKGPNATMVGIFGVAAANTSAAASGPIRTSGALPGVLTGATPGTAYYMGSTGLPVLKSSLAYGDTLIQLGFAKNATDLEINIQNQGVL